MRGRPWPQRIRDAVAPATTAVPAAVAGEVDAAARDAGTAVALST